MSIKLFDGEKFSKFFAFVMSEMRMSTSPSRDGLNSYGKVFSEHFPTACKRSKTETSSSLPMFKTRKFEGEISFSRARQNAYATSET